MRMTANGMARPCSAPRHGLPHAFRPELTPAENLLRDGELRAEIRRCFGLLHLRGRYVADYGLPHVKTTEEYACFVSSHPDDSGNLKGFLRKYGRKYGQDSIIYKGYYRDAVLLALSDPIETNLRSSVDLFKSRIRSPRRPL
jgi:hypothetical protein